jgi:hypothetical protein
MAVDRGLVLSRVKMICPVSIVLLHASEQNHRKMEGAKRVCLQSFEDQSHFIQAFK